MSSSIVAEQPLHREQLCIRKIYGTGLTRVAAMWYSLRMHSPSCGGSICLRYEQQRNLYAPMTVARQTFSMFPGPRSPLAIVGSAFISRRSFLSLGWGQRKKNTLVNVIVQL